MTRPVTDLQRRVAPFEVKAPFEPSGDQPAAIAALAERIRSGERDTVLLGATGAARVASLIMVLAQAGVIAVLVAWDRPWHAAAIGALTLVQAGMMWRFIQSPRERALWLSALGVPFYVSGMMIAAFAARTMPAMVEVTR